MNLPSMPVRARLRLRVTLSTPHCYNALPETFMNDERMFTLPVALQRYVGGYTTEWGLFAAGAVIVSLPVVALFFALQRNLVGGLTAGGVKG